MKKIDKREKRPLSGGKLHTQAAVCATIWQELCAGVFGRNQVADRTLAGILRERRELGSRDRRFISETVFGFFRYWGVIRFLIPAEDAETLAETGNTEHISDLDRSKLLLAANLLSYQSGSLPEAVSVWANHLRLKLPDFRNLESVAQLFKAPAEFLNLENLVPTWVKDELDTDLDWDSICKALQTRPPLWLRAQVDTDALVAELSTEGVPTIKHPATNSSLAVVDTRVNLYTLESFKSGKFEVQDLASQLIGLVCNPKAGERWWDACAGAGGKALQLASLMNRKGTVVATDIRAYKLDDLRKRARRSGFPNITTKEWDGKKLRQRDSGKFDGVLVDAPCSCSGTWRRNPDGRWLLTQPELAELAEIQYTVLSNASTGVKAGGVLVYGTCSMFGVENMAVVNRFLADNPTFELESFVHPLTGMTTSGWVMADMLTGNSDAMFAARMRKKK